MARLIAPTARLHAAWLRSHRDWGPGVHQDGAGLGPLDDVETPEGFAAWAHHGGVLEDIRDTEIGRLRRYWIGVSER